MKKIIYLGYYDVPENASENRRYVLAATNKMTYICSAINNAGYEVEIVSASETKNKWKYKGKEIDILPKTKLRLFLTHAYSNNKLRRMFCRWNMKIRYCFYLYKNTKKGDSIIVYHSLGYDRAIRLLKKLKKFRLILEVEEIYSDVTKNEKTRRREETLFSVADAFIFPTELLNEKVNIFHKPSTIIYGTYQVEKDRQCKFENIDLQNKINLLYAGTFDPRKGGAATAVATAVALSEDYHIHIIGFGSEKDRQKLEKQIKHTAEKAAAGISYDGLYSGEDYIRFVQNCQVGFSTQMPEAAFNTTSFPSKVLSYLANGLRVVSVRLEVLERSAISDLLYYYDEQTPEAIAEVIKKIDFSAPYDSRKIIAALDKKFVKEIGELLR